METGPSCAESLSETGSATPESAEELVVCRIDQQNLEVHCHGGWLAASQIVDSLVEIGYEQVPSPRDQRPRLLVEAEQQLPQAITRRAATHLLAQVNGSLLHWAEALRSRIRSVAAEPSLPNVAMHRELADEVGELLQRKDYAERLLRPAKIVICGRPNVGKSSLINRLLGFDRSVVFDSPGTTRDVISEHAAIDGWPVEFFDTAGVRQTEDEIESAGIDSARQAISQADLLIVMFDASQIRETVDELPSLVAAVKDQLPEFFNAQQPNLRDSYRKSILPVLNKIDCVPDWSEGVPTAVRNNFSAAVRELLLEPGNGREAAQLLPANDVAALTGTGVDRLVQSIAFTLGGQSVAADAPLLITRRQLETASQLREHLAAQRYKDAAKAIESLIGSPI